MPADGGEVWVVVFDPSLEEISTLIIPPNTQVEVSRQLGKWQAKSLWQLGKDEGWDGKLLAETVTNHLKMPTIGWADSTAQSFVAQDLPGIIKTILFTEATNLSFGDKLGIGVFSLGVKNTHNNSIDMSETTYLRGTTLPGGESGFVVSGSVPQNIVAIFSDEDWSKRGINVLIEDNSGHHGLAEELGKVIRVIGADVGSIERGDVSDIDCEVRGSEKDYLEKFVLLYDCNLQPDEETGFDVEIRIGKRFAEKF